MKVLRRHRTTASTRGDIATRFSSGISHPRYQGDESLLAQLGKLQLGTLRLTGRITTGGRSRRYAEVTCKKCGELQSILVDNLKAGKTANCKCQRALKHGGSATKAVIPAKQLAGRYDAILQRCNNPNCRAYPDYGMRGIQCLFQSRAHFIQYMMAEFPLSSYEGLEIDRKNNEGHYEPGNVRLITKAGNARNRRNSRLINYAGKVINATDLWTNIRADHPTYRYSKSWTYRMYHEYLMTVAQIIAHGTRTYTIS